jgi:hypothetical protein
MRKSRVVRGGRLDAFDVGVLLAFSALSVWLLAVLLAKQSPARVWTGTDGPYVGDQLQYLAWIRETARHVLISNPFRVEPTTASFLHPGLALSGAFTHVGLSPSLAYLVWKPVAVVALFVAARAYVRGLLDTALERRAALVLALFYLSPASLVADTLHWKQLVAIQAIVFEMWPGLYLWGYPFTAIAVAALAGTLLAYGRDRDEGRIRPWAPLLGFTCAWLQPWQGATVVVIILLAEVVLRLRGHRVAPTLPAIAVAATTIPLVYYSLLGRFDSTWKIAGQANRVPLWPTWTLAVALAPLALPALLAYRRPAATFQQLALLTWPVAALGVYFLIGVSHVGTYPLHALQGLSIPFAVLAVAGVRTLRPQLPATLGAVAVVMLVALLTLPAIVRQLNQSRTTGDDGPAFFAKAPFFITHGEHDALHYIQRSSRSGAVLAPVSLGETVPAETGRRTWVGLLSWTPNYTQRVALADRLFSGRLQPDAARAFVQSTGATFLVSDCQHRTDLSAALRPILVLVKRFECATLYIVR